MSKIIKALKQAVRYAKGDKSAGKLTIISVPNMTLEEQKIMMKQKAWRKARKVEVE